MPQTTLFGHFFKKTAQNNTDGRSSKSRRKSHHKSKTTDRQEQRSSGTMSRHQHHNTDRTSQSFAEKRRADLRLVAKETLETLPSILSQVPQLDFRHASIHHFYAVAPLKPSYCPGYTLQYPSARVNHKGTRIRVLDADTFTAALTLQYTPTTPATLLSNHIISNPSNPGQSTGAKPVLVINLANATYPGGGWLNGALAQEEALCYRSSLSLSLKQDHYPIPLLSALYTPHCLVIREEMSAGHRLLWPRTPATNLPVVSVVTLAALCRPRLAYPRTTAPAPVFARREDREITAYKVRLVLRIAALHGHTRLVLGALGCGAFRNPPQEVATIFREVLTEDEFRGGWWEDVVFAVMDNARGARGGKQGEGNYGIFWRELDGVVV